MKINMSKISTSLSSAIAFNSDKYRHQIQHGYLRSMEPYLQSVLDWNIIIIVILIWSSITFFSDVDECMTGQHMCSPEGGICVDHPGSYTCQCLSGYEGEFCNTGKRVGSMRLEPTLFSYWRSFSMQYSRTPIARTLMARLPRLFRIRSWVPRKKSLAADLGHLVWFSFFYIENGILCVLNEAILMRTRKIPSCYRKSKKSL